VLTQLIQNPNGRHHNRLKDCRAVINFGDPLRCPGLARGNDVAGFPVPGELDGHMTGGIAGPANLTPDQSELIYSCALMGDLYAACPCGESPWNTPGKGAGENEAEVGQIETRIYEFVLSGSLIKGLMYIAEGIAEEFSMPVSATIAHMQAIINGLKFASAGTAAPHWQYAPFVPPMINWLLNNI
jgi:hypothetical protein